MSEPVFWLLRTGHGNSVHEGAIPPVDGIGWQRVYTQAQIDAQALAKKNDGLGFPPVLDACCGSRMFWFSRKDSRALFGDKRRETLKVTDRSHGREDGTRTISIEPDTLMDFRSLPFADDSFFLVVFDPPHLVRAGTHSWLAAKYGKLGTDWRNDLRQGFDECFRVLRPNGTLVFKWSETQIKLREVLELAPHPPLFGNAAGKKNGTHWVVFMKPPTVNGGLA